MRSHAETLAPSTALSISPTQRYLFRRAVRNVSTILIPDRQNTHVVGRVNLLDEVATNKRKTLEDVLLYARDAGSVEESGKAESSAEASGLEAPRYPSASSSHDFRFSSSFDVGGCSSTPLAPVLLVPHEVRNATSTDALPSTRPLTPRLPCLLTIPNPCYRAAHSCIRGRGSTYSLMAILPVMPWKLGWGCRL